MKTFGWALVLLLLSTGISPAQAPRRRGPAPPADAASVDSIVNALYASVSHEPGASPDFERMRRIFLFVGMLVPPKRAGEEFTVMDVDGFEERVRKSIAARKEKGEPAGFFEKEIARRTDCFGNVCQVFSTYESRRSPSDPKPFERGINAIQLLRDGERWWIASVVWDSERPENPIPVEYLGGTGPGAGSR
jgi:hypothetical protein